ncbi:hypothetical protein BJX76DRAFT_347822 [Aspergillus varians]
MSASPPSPLQTTPRIQEASPPEPFQALQQIVGYVERHKGATPTVPPTTSQYSRYHDLALAGILGFIAVNQTQHFSWQARFAYLQWSSLSSTFEQLLGGSAVTAALVIFFVSPFPILSLTAVLLLAWQYVLVRYHKAIRHVAAEVEEVSYKAKVAVENSRAYAKSVAAHEQSILSLVAALYNGSGQYNLEVFGHVPELGPLLAANVDTIVPTARELTALVTNSSSDLPKALRAFEEVKWLADRANLLAKHGEIAEAASLVESVSTGLASILEVEAQLLDAKTQAHEVSVRIHLDDVVESLQVPESPVPVPVPESPVAESPAPEPSEPEPVELPNAVTLKNPKAIVGSLSGAEKDVDDEAFNLDLPFPIVIYGHSTSVLSINDNGMICLDQAPTQSIQSVRTGQPLPYHNGLAPYSIFPLWTDLKIAKGQPHGIYWDVEGTAPNRKLIIEYYVTRYHMESQYFHFLVILEESRPNVVSFKYYDVQDRGQEGTVGVQGPDEHKQFSHNERVISPGLQVVFDTTPGVNSSEASTFELPNL